MVSCPYEGCSFQSNVYSTFNTYKSKEHPVHSNVVFKPDIVAQNVLEDPLPAFNDQPEENVLEVDDDDAELDITFLSENVEE